MESLFTLVALVVLALACPLYTFFALIRPLEKLINQRERRTSLEIRKGNRNSLIGISIFSFLGALFSGLPFFAQAIFIIVPLVFMTQLMKANMLEKGFMKDKELKYFGWFILFLLIFIGYGFKIANPFQAIMIMPLGLGGIIFLFFRFNKPGPAIGVTLAD